MSEDNEKLLENVVKLENDIAIINRTLSTISKKLEEVTKEKDNMLIEGNVLKKCNAKLDAKIKEFEDKIKAVETEKFKTEKDFGLSSLELVNVKKEYELCKTKRDETLSKFDSLTQKIKRKKERSQKFKAERLLLEESIKTFKDKIEANKIRYKSKLKKVIGERTV